MGSIWTGERPSVPRLHSMRPSTSLERWHRAVERSERLATWGLGIVAAVAIGLALAWQ